MRRTTFLILRSGPKDRVSKDAGSVCSGVGWAKRREATRAHVQHIRVGTAGVRPPLPTL
jgi:hypothetical protein